jgi:phage-related protein
MSAVVEIILQGTDKASSVVGGLEQSLGGLASVAQGALTVGLGVAAAGAGALVAGLGLSISEAMGAEKIQAQLAAVLKSTGGAAGVTADMANNLATALSKTSTFSDDAILKGENLLLTFTNIGKDVFPDATQVMVDMATALGTDVSGGAIQLGKALNDPVAGISALSRVGVSFTEEQKKVIQSLVETGDVAGAQQIILAELNKEFGGSAAGAAGTFGGQLEVVKNQLLNVAEGIGMNLLPVGHLLIDQFLMPALPIIESVGANIATFLTSLFNGTSAVQPVIDALRTAFISVFTSIQSNLMPAISGLVGQFSGELPTAQSVFETVINAIVGAIGFVTNVITTILIPIFTSVVNWVSANWPTIQATVSNVFTAVQNIINTVMPIVRNVITTVLGFIQTFWNQHGQAIMTIVTTMFNNAKTSIETVINVIRSIIEFVLERIQIFWDAWGETIMEVIRNMTSVIGSIIEAFASALEGDWTAFGENLRSAWDGIWESIKLIVTNAIDIFLNFDWAGIGSNIIKGIADGISNATQFIVDAAKSAAKAAFEAAKAFLGIHSPSTLFAGIGSNMMEGMSIGIDRGSDLPVSAMNNATGRVTNQAVNNTFYQTIYSNARTEDVAGQFSTMKTLMGGI